MVFPAASESPCEGVIVKEGGGEGGGDDMEGVGGGGGGGGDVGAEVTEGDVEVTVVVEVGRGRTWSWWKGGVEGWTTVVSRIFTSIFFFGGGSLFWQSILGFD